MRPRLRSRFGKSSGFIVAEPRVQLRKSLFQKGDILLVRRLQLPQIALVNVRDLSGLYAFEELDQPISLFMPVLRAHDRLHVALSMIGDWAIMSACLESGPWRPTGEPQPSGIIDVRLAVAQFCVAERPLHSFSQHMELQNRDTDWTPEQLAQLMRLSRDNLSALEIASKLGRTEEAVQFKARQMGLTLSKRKGD